jgi:late competence protein required for DNA uptake (superfamily II DNA/RNA helicase)
MKRLHEEVIPKESSDLKSSTPRTQNISPEPTQQHNRFLTHPLSRSQENFQSAFLTEISITFHLTNSEIVQSITQSLQQLENTLFLNLQKPKNGEFTIPRHKYLRPPVTEEVSDNPPHPKKILSSENSNSLHEKFILTKSKWLDSNSKFQSILLLVCPLHSVGDVADAFLSLL